MKKKLIITSFIILFTLTGYFVFKPKNDKKVMGISEISYTLTDVSTHSTLDSCWTVIDAEVYDVTKFISKHPGGNRILSACGVDATSLFNGTSPMGRMHSAVAKGLLSGMKIGNFKSN